MKLIFLYGPPAAGKLTIAKELVKLVGYKLYDNHAIISPLGELFTYTDPELNAIRVPLGKRIRVDVFGSAAKAGINFIATSGGGGEKDFIFFRELQRAIETNDGTMLFVQVLPTKEALLFRVDQPSRVGVKADTKMLLEEILQQNPGIFEKFPDQDHLTLNNTDLLAPDAAQLIVQYYNL